ncbi:MAG: AAA family ATPase [Piscinibacter sp.]|uniref:AAA family ATPase n=1 Tax=Piscinibacter sp. TaxID=1903157 RepID=UPI003D0A1505
MSAFVVALLGAESTGKTTLAQEIGMTLAARGERVAVVGEYLREFCDREGRTPRIDEQRSIAAEQTRRIAAAAAGHDVVVADTSALMIAVYSDHVFGDPGLYDEALAAHARCQLTLLTALDLPWQSDGHQRDGPHVREPVDAKVRAALARAALDCSVVFGHGPERLANALAAVERARRAPEALPEGRRWRWVCERCGDADCERHWLPRL